MKVNKGYLFLVYENMSKVQNESNNVVKRGLKDRHISMIAIGGCIGTGLFVTSGGAIHDAGALGA